MVDGYAADLTRLSRSAQSDCTDCAAHCEGTRDADVARPAVQLDLARSPAQLLRVGFPRDRLILVGGGEHDIARRPIHDPLTGVRVICATST